MVAMFILVVIQVHVRPAIVRAADLVTVILVIRHVLDLHLMDIIFAQNVAVIVILYLAHIVIAVTIYMVLVVIKVAVVAAADLVAAEVAEAVDAS